MECESNHSLYQITDQYKQIHLFIQRAVSHLRYSIVGVNTVYLLSMSIDVLVDWTTIASMMLMICLAIVHSVMLESDMSSWVINWGSIVFSLIQTRQFTRNHV